MKAFETRRDNLRFLVALYPSQSALAEIIGVHPSYMNQLLHGRRNIGEKTARKIETAAGLDELWLDNAGEQQ